MKGLRKALYIVGVAAVLVYSAWWVATALGVVGLIGDLLWTSLTGWYKFGGLKRAYLLGGAITVVALGVAYGVPAVVALFRDFADDWISIVVAVVVVGCVPILLIPLVTVGWPLVWWLFIADRIEKRRRTASGGTAGPENLNQGTGAQRL